MIGINLMVAMEHYEEHVEAAVEAGVDIIISGAGLPLTLPAHLKGSQTMFAPIVSSARAAKALLKNYRIAPLPPPKARIYRKHRRQ